MRRTSKKTAALYRKCGPLRDKYVRRVWLCECCCKRPATQCHEICNGPNRLVALGERCCWLAVCTRCNCDWLTDKRAYPLARQLALKKRADPKRYDRLRVLAIKGWAETAVSEDEVKEWM